MTPERKSAAPSPFDLVASAAPKTRGGHDEPPSFCPDDAGCCLSDRRRAFRGTTRSAGPATGPARRAPARDALGPRSVRQRRGRARPRGRTRVGAARRDCGDAQRRRCHLILHDGRPRAARARGRPHRAAARSEHGQSRGSGAWTLGERPDDADARELPDQGPDVRRAEAAGLLLLDRLEPRRLRPRRPVPRRRLLTADARRLLLPRVERDVEAVQPGAAATGRHDHDDDEHRRNRRLRHPLGARHDRPLHLHHRGPRSDRLRPGIAAVLESQADHVLRRRRSDRPLPGLEQPGRVALPVRPRQGLRDRVVDRDEDEHALQPRPRRRDRADGQVALRHRVRRSGLHRRPRRLRRRDPAVRLRPEPSGPARRRDPPVLVPGHGHADDPRR